MGEGGELDEGTGILPILTIRPCLFLRVECPEAIEFSCRGVSVPTCRGVSAYKSDMMLSLCVVK